MPEIRKNKITGEFVILAPERAKRPHDFVSTKKDAPLPQHSPNCPLCTGNEHMTPPETFRYPGSGPWSIRCVPNKFSALSPEGELWWKSEGIKTSMAGVGLHEVLVETSRHDLCIALMQDEEVKNIVRAYHNRFLAFHKDPRVEQVILFKNHGTAAGTSLEHAHSQIVGIPITPTQIRYRYEDAHRYFMDNGRCLLCSTLDDELSDGKRVVVESTHFAAFIPYAAMSPFHMWIFPKRHSGCFGDATVEELDDLAVVLKKVLRMLYIGLENPDFNYSLRTATPAEAGSRHLHWYIAIIPRVTKTAGFELGTGMRINPSLPEASAEFLRGVDISL